MADWATVHQNCCPVCQRESRNNCSCKWQTGQWFLTGTAAQSARKSRCSHSCRWHCRRTWPYRIQGNWRCSLTWHSSHHIDGSLVEPSQYLWCPLASAVFCAPSPAKQSMVDSIQMNVQWIQTLKHPQI